MKATIILHSKEGVSRSISHLNLDLPRNNVPCSVDYLVRLWQSCCQPGLLLDKPHPNLKFVRVDCGILFVQSENWSPSRWCQSPLALHAFFHVSEPHHQSRLKQHSANRRVEIMKMERLPFGWNGKGWPQDKLLMELVFEVHGLLEIAQGQVTRESLEAVETFDHKQALIKQMITSTIPFHRQRQLSRCKTASEMWVRLCEVYESPIMKERAISRAMRELTSLQCGPRQDVQVHMWKMLGLRFTLGFYGHKVSDNTMVTIMLESLPDSEACRILRRHVQYGVNRNKRIPERLRELIDIGECYTIYQAEARNDLDKSDVKKCRQRRSIRTSKKCCWHCGVLGNVRSQCPDRIHG